jgi:RNA polymerase sigma-70 factor (sigma-E family)
MQIGRSAVSGRRDDEFTQYVGTRLGSLRRIAFLFCQDWQRADDLVQITITRLYVHWGRASAVEHTDAYVKTILVREFLGEQRSGWARRVSLDAQVPDTAGPMPDLAAALDVRAALAGLPSRQRATVVLRFYCDMNVDQAAQVLGCSPGTIKSQTAKGLDALRRALRPAQAGESTSARPPLPCGPRSTRQEVGENG